MQGKDRMDVHFEKSGVLALTPPPGLGVPPADVPLETVAPVERTFVLCADDYGIARGVDRAIEHLIESGRVTATGAMVTMPCWKRDAPGLAALVRATGAQVGLHLTLTEQRSASPARGLAQEGRLPSLRTLLLSALARRLPAAAVAEEIRAQFDAFEDVWGAPPAFVDGHQHVHLLPTVREALVAEILNRYAPGTLWVRDCRETVRRIRIRGVGERKALFLRRLGRGLKAALLAHGIAHNQGFSGLHDFKETPPFREKMGRFLAALGPRALVHVHPGRVDAALLAVDTLTTPREWEYEYLASDAFVADCARLGVRPTTPSWSNQPHRSEENTPSRVA